MTYAKLAAATICTAAIATAAVAAPAAARYADEVSRIRPLAMSATHAVVPAIGDADGIIWDVPMRRREIALTFDDGPYPFYTPLLLHILVRSHIHATFFLVGRNAQEFPELVERIVAAGDEIGNHTFNHYHLTRLDDREIRRQIAEAGIYLRRLARRPITLFRPPHGRYDRRVLTIARELGYQTILWTDGASDYKLISPALETRRILARAKPGGIILLHSGEYRTVEALPSIVAALRWRGYQIVPVGQLLRDAQDAGTRIDKGY